MHVKTIRVTNGTCYIMVHVTKRYRTCYTTVCVNRAVRVQNDTVTNRYIPSKPVISSGRLISSTFTRNI